jgi:3-hydroxyisobutyrate dehydrogenase-like beta-hydroxyacid dehydrogenase
MPNFDFLRTHHAPVWIRLVRVRMINKIGLVGIGLVGTAIAEQLLAAHFHVIGFDTDSAKCEHLEQSGGKTAHSPAEVAQQTDRVVLSLPDNEAVRQVIEGPGGVLQATTLPTYIIDTTTGDPEETIRLAQRLAERGICFLDATISGSSEQVRNRQAVFMVGGEKAAFETCRDVLDAVSEKMFYLGPSGSGSKAKLASNLILGLNRAALAEGLVFASKLGLEPEAFLELLKVTPAYSAAMDTKGKKMLSRNFAPESRIRQHHKDVSIILKYAEKTGQELPLSRVHLDILEKSIAAGDGEMDNAAVIREIERRKKL